MSGRGQAVSSELFAKRACRGKEGDGRPQSHSCSELQQREGHQEFPCKVPFVLFHQKFLQEMDNFSEFTTSKCN